jgi:siroheme synthase (precorrin-2 oxidase/ferrochelatase)
VQVGVTTGGSGPRLAARVRDALEAALPAGLADQADELRRSRRRR